MPGGMLPGVKTPGYSQSVPPGHKRKPPGSSDSSSSVLFIVLTDASSESTPDPFHHQPAGGGADGLSLRGRVWLFLVQAAAGQSDAGTQLPDANGPHRVSRCGA